MAPWASQGQQCRGSECWARGGSEEEGPEGVCAVLFVWCRQDKNKSTQHYCHNKTPGKQHENLSHDPVTHKRVKNPHSGSQPLHSLGSRPILQAHLTRVPLCRRRCHWWRTACLHSPNWVRNFFSPPPPTDPFPPTEALWITHPQRLSSPARSNHHTCLY